MSGAAGVQRRRARTREGARPIPPVGGADFRRALLRAGLCQAEISRIHAGLALLQREDRAWASVRDLRGEPAGWHVWACNYPLGPCCCRHFPDLPRDQRRYHLRRDKRAIVSERERGRVRERGKRVREQQAPRTISPGSRRWVALWRRCTRDLPWVAVAGPGPRERREVAA